MKCLLTGASGNLGKELQKVGEEFGIEYFPMAGRVECNISDTHSIVEYCCKHANELRDIQKIIHCAAYTNVAGAEINKKQAIETNIIGTKNIISEMCDCSASITYISTDYVYEGKAGNYKETDITCPVNFYSFTKLAGEAYIGTKDLIIRTSFKPSVWQYQKAFSDIYTSADYIDIIARKISFLIKNDAFGVYNVGTKRKSIFELAKRRNENVQPMSKNEIKNVILPSDISMNVEKFESFFKKHNGE
ncbi:MAG: sugar nucleotide-binding protein [Patescibacteria group bacterium]